MTAKRKKDTDWNLDAGSKSAPPRSPAKPERGEAFGTYLPPELRIRLKLYATETGEHMWAVVQAAIAEYLQQRGR